MRFRQIRTSVRKMMVPALLACLVLSPAGARADSDLGMQVLNFLGIGVGGYWFNSDSADRALGTPKFVGHTTFYVKPAHRHGWKITGGYQEISIKDHWQPFSGGNKVNLQGIAMKVSKEKQHRFDLVPFVNFGVYYGHIRSDKLGFKDNRIVPSIAVGLEKEVVRYVRLSAGYRMTESIGGVNTSGGYLSLTLFP
jgi:hypothetical protein